MYFQGWLLELICGQMIESRLFHQCNATRNTNILLECGQWKTSYSIQIGQIGLSIK